MADDTLSPVGFESRVVKTHMEGQERYALACIMGGAYHGTAAGLVRDLLERGLAERGWPLERRIKAYADYRLECLRDNVANEYEGE
jgi:hypothetical protein